MPYPWANQPPYYGWIDWDLYLAPERRINYAPSRGCFWNKCTFCDYGLNDDGPTAPSRTMDVDVVISHLRPVVSGGVRHIYFAADAIAPGFLDAFADRAIAEGLDLRWSGQFFLTRNFTSELVARLASSGLALASFGLESGSSRILELMGKGSNRIERVLRHALNAFRDSPIGLQPLFFFGFPGETDEDRQETVDLLLAYRDVLSVVTKGGQFELLPGSIVAKRPADFGVADIRRRPGDDIAGSLEYSLSDGTSPPTCDAYRGFNDQLPHCALFERPWAGAIDTFHSQLYVERHGRDVFHRIRQDHGMFEPEFVNINVKSFYDINEIIQNVTIYRAWNSPGCLVPALKGQLEESFAEITTPAEPFDRPECYEVRLRPYRET